MDEDLKKKLDQIIVDQYCFFAMTLIILIIILWLK